MNIAFNLVRVSSRKDKWIGQASGNSEGSAGLQIERVSSAKLRDASGQIDSALEG